MLLAAFLIGMPRGRWHGETQDSAAANQSMSRDTYHVIRQSLWLPCGEALFYYVCHQADYRRELLIVFPAFKLNHSSWDSSIMY